MKKRELSVFGGTTTRAGLVAGVLALAVFTLARTEPWLVERIYGRILYPPIASALAFVSARAPFSIVDSVIACLALLAIVLPWRFWRRARAASHSRVFAIGGSVVRLAALLGAAWSLFLVVWGFNYLRPSAASLLHVPAPERDAVAPIVANVESRLDALREALPEDVNGVVLMPEDIEELDRHVSFLQESVFSELDIPIPHGARTKPLLVSPLSRRWGVSGFYGPFTAEPTIVMPPLPAQLPMTLAHERAHFAGIASEDAATFFAMLTLWRSDRPSLRYAAWLDLWMKLRRPIDARHPGVERDVRAIQQHIERYRGFERDAMWRLYDRGLKAHGVREGTRSYSRAAPLALAYLADRGFPEDALDEGDERESAAGP
ncbi:MAG: DUF3810 domain-containing protein [Acidobacteria bacterium]|nr:DUF3810 domain-containing protein [Acidobacteriota bacterium]